jgi:hypothetical protein
MLDELKEKRKPYRSKILELSDEVKCLWDNKSQAVLKLVELRSMRKQLGNDRAEVERLDIEIQDELPMEEFDADFQHCIDVQEVATKTDVWLTFLANQAYETLRSNALKRCSENRAANDIQTSQNVQSWPETTTISIRKNRYSKKAKRKPRIPCTIRKRKIGPTCNRQYSRRPVQRTNLSGGTQTAIFAKHSPRTTSTGSTGCMIIRLVATFVIRLDYDPYHDEISTCKRHDALAALAWWQLSPYRKECTVHQEPMNWTAETVERVLIA